MKVLCEACEKPFDTTDPKKVFVTVMVTASPGEKGPQASQPVEVAYCSGKCLSDCDLNGAALTLYREIVERGK